MSICLIANIFLQLGDVITEMPEGYLKPMEVIDTTRRVLLKAAEVERGMARGKPSVSLVSLYKQVPEIFVMKPFSIEVSGQGSLTTACFSDPWLGSSQSLPA